MFNRPLLTRALCALAVLACAANASADTRSVSVTSDITNFGWRLIDLNPNDGIAPALTIDRDSIWTLSTYDLDGHPFPYDIRDERRSYGSTAVNGLRGGASTDLSATASHQRASLASDAGDFATTSANSFLTLNFTLTPYTAVLFNAAAAITPAVSDTATTELYAQGSLRGWLNSDGQTYGEFDDGFTLKTEVDNPVELGFREYYLGGYLQSDGNAVTGRVDFNASVGVTLDGPTTPVPEPEIYAMLLGGLGLVGWSARRRATVRNDR